MAKAKGKERPTASDVPADVEVAAGDDINAEQTPSEPVKMEDAVETTVVECDKPEEAEKEEVKEDGTTDAAMTTVIPEVEKAEEGNKLEVVKADDKVESASKKKAKRIKKRKKVAGANAATSNGANKAETPDAEKQVLKKVDGMGLIFMCNSKTKKDCYQYKVFGLPASKKEIVEKVYKGMRLFLFDFDLKLMYGIYKAASPGGYNLEPKAFKSAFPAQVRFTVLNDCNPLPEEKFKAAIKENYYGRNKFNCELSPEQVKNLCKLFMSASKASHQKPTGGPSRAPISVGRDRKRGPPRDFTQKRGPPRDFAQRPAAGGHAYPRGPPLYPREAYASPPPRPFTLPAPPPPSYAYDRPVDDYYYRRELPFELREHRIMDVEMMPRDPVEYRDPYALYREPAPYPEALYPASRPSAYAPPPPLYPY